MSLTSITEPLARFTHAVITGAREAVPTAAAAGGAAAGAGLLGKMAHSPEILTFVAQAILVGLTVSGRFGRLVRQVEQLGQTVTTLTTTLNGLNCVQGKPCATPPPASKTP